MKHSDLSPIQRRAGTLACPELTEWGEIETVESDKIRGCYIYTVMNQIPQALTKFGLSHAEHSKNPKRVRL